MLKEAAHQRAAAKTASHSAPSRFASRPFAPQAERREARACVASGPAFSFDRLALQAKLTVGQANDPLEQEADRVAERVMRMPEPSTTPGAILQRACASCQEEDKVHRSTTGSPASERAAPRILHDVLRSPGRPLDPSTRRFMEPRFGYDFSNVRIHRDALASQSTEAIDAHAYTVGNNVAFRHGQYAPTTTKGRQLLAHELAHVVQQGHAGGMVSQTSPAIPSGGVGERVQRDGETPPDQSNAPNLEQEYQTAVRMGDWQAAA